MVVCECHRRCCGCGCGCGCGYSWVGNARPGSTPAARYNFKQSSRRTSGELFPRMGRSMRRRQLVWLKNGDTPGGMANRRAAVGRSPLPLMVQLLRTKVVKIYPSLRVHELEPEVDALRKARRAHSHSFTRCIMEDKASRTDRRLSCTVAPLKPRSRTTAP